MYNRTIDPVIDSNVNDGPTNIGSLKHKPNWIINLIIDLPCGIPTCEGWSRVNIYVSIDIDSIPP